ncbi:MAG TPA: SDR family NAD(P)-dependent oxidoreductase [Rubrobacteraceae bacterium]|jgi:NAD(P)-dependent dehydrogenase (short-subunit alcohol dehydrogenase family)|nr:SDR family NAD(P)-dependent oxidoreductase [Rubrobacteraceae bacterium]
MQLQGKVTIITGAATGIGSATAVLFAREGASVVIADINEDDAQRTVADIEDEGGSARFVQTDVCEAEDMRTLMERAVEEMGGIDVIVNNAGAQRSGAVTEFEESEWDLLMRVNPRSCFLGAKYSVPYLRERGGGSIVNVSSLAGLKGGPGMTAYSASKGAIIAFTRALAEELAPDNIRANSVCPGWIDTPFNEPAIEFMGGRAQQEEMVQQMVPLKRQGTPEEIAPGILYLASDASSYVTGQELVIDGGFF